MHGIINNSESLRMIMFWDMNQHLLDVENNKLVYKTLPSANTPLDSATTRRVTQFVLVILENLYTTMMYSKDNLLNYQSHYDLTASAESIEISIKFMNASKEKISKVIANAEAEDKARGFLSLPRTELPSIQAIVKKLTDDIPSSISFTPHAGKDLTGLIISELNLHVNNVKKLIYRINGDTRASNCASSSLSMEISDGPHIISYNEIEIKVFQKGPVIRILSPIHFSCNEPRKAHRCAAELTKCILKQVIKDNQPSLVVIYKRERSEENAVKEVINSYGGDDFLHRRNAFFLETVKQ